MDWVTRTITVKAWKAANDTQTPLRRAKGSFPHPIRLGPSLYHSTSVTASCLCISPQEIMNSQRAKLFVVRTQKAHCFLVQGTTLYTKGNKCPRTEAFDSANTFSLVSFFFSLFDGN